MHSVLGYKRYGSTYPELQVSCLNTGESARIVLKSKVVNIYWRKNGIGRYDHHTSSGRESGPENASIEGKYP